MIIREKTKILLWENEDGKLKHFSNANIRRRDTFNKKAIAIKLIGKLEPTIFSNTLFDTNVAGIIAKDEDHFLAFWAYANSQDFYNNVRTLNQKLNVTSAILVKVPFDLEHWQKVAEEKYPSGLPKPYSDDPTQWLFHGHPKYTEAPLQVTIARLMGYKWPAENDPEMELSEEAREKIQGIKELVLPFDEDGIVCIPPVNGEASAAERLRENIIKIWGEQYNGNTLSELINQEGSKQRDIENYLREDFFVQHCKLFKSRPFIWHIWDGRKDGFCRFGQLPQIR